MADIADRLPLGRARADAEGPGVLRVQLIVAWPVWAGGYPKQGEAFAQFQSFSSALVTELQRCVDSSLGPEFRVTELHCTQGGHSLISGLSPRT